MSVEKRLNVMCTTCGAVNVFVHSFQMSQVEDIGTDALCAYRRISSLELASWWTTTLSNTACQVSTTTCPWICCLKLSAVYKHAPLQQHSLFLEEEQRAAEEWPNDSQGLYRRHNLHVILAAPCCCRAR